MNRNGFSSAIPRQKALSIEEKITLLSAAGKTYLCGYLDRALAGTKTRKHTTRPKKNKGEKP